MKYLLLSLITWVMLYLFIAFITWDITFIAKLGDLEAVDRFFVIVMIVIPQQLFITCVYLYMKESGHF